MESTSNLFKLLSNPKRLAILRRLMSSQATLTQLGEHFQESPAHIRHHLKLLEDASLVEFIESRPVLGGQEKYYRASQHAIIIHQAVMPDFPAGKQGLMISSIDSAVRMLADQLSRTTVPIFLVHMPLSSMDGLIALRQGLCQISASHLIEPRTEVYNRAYVRMLFPGQAMALIRVFCRMEGLIVQPGNPRGIRSLEDLTRPELRFVNRETGSGVRQWLDLQLEKLGILPEYISSHQSLARSHNAIARQVQQKTADFGVGLAESAHQFGMDFVPLYEEPYELVFPESLTASPEYAPFFEYLNTGDFRTSLSNLSGYMVSQTSGSVEVIR